MLRWMLSPNDSWQTPICRERKRLSIADLLGDHLVDGGAAGPSAREHLARDEAAHRVVVPVPRPGQAGRRIVDAAEHVDVLAVPGQRLQAGRHLIVGTVLARDPVLLDDPVAVEPEHEPGLDRPGGDARPGRIGGSAGIEQRLERRQPDADRGPRQAHAPQERAAGQLVSCGHESNPSLSGGRVRKWPGRRSARGSGSRNHETSRAARR